jgi:hypothetical protein
VERREAAHDREHQSQLAEISAEAPVKLPSTTISDTVMKRDSSELRNKMALAISSEAP